MLEWMLKTTLILQVKKEGVSKANESAQTHSVINDIPSTKSPITNLSIIAH